MTPYAWKITRNGTSLVIGEGEKGGAIIGICGEDGTLNGIRLDLKDVMQVRDAIENYIDVAVAKNGISYLKGLVKEGNKNDRPA